MKSNSTPKSPRSITGGKGSAIETQYVYVGIGGGITGDIRVNVILKFLLDPLFSLPKRVGFV